MKVKEIVILYVIGNLADEFEFYSIYKVLGIEIREKKYSIKIAYKYKYLLTLFPREDRKESNCFNVFNNVFEQVPNEIWYNNYNRIVFIKKG